MKSIKSFWEHIKKSCQGLRRLSKIFSGIFIEFFLYKHFGENPWLKYFMSLIIFCSCITISLRVSLNFDKKLQVLGAFIKSILQKIQITRRLHLIDSNFNERKCLSEVIFKNFNVIKKRISALITVLKEWMKLAKLSLRNRNRLS